MKTSATSAALLALAFCTTAAPAMQAREAAVPQGNITFVLASVTIGEEPSDVFATDSDDDRYGLWFVRARSWQGSGQHRFVWDPSTNHVVVAQSGPKRFVYVRPDKKWTFSTKQPEELDTNSSAIFRIQPFEKGYGHDNDLELRAYDGKNNSAPLTGLFSCDLYNPGDNARAIYSGPEMPRDCQGGAMGLMVTQVDAN
ncbi:MAG: hypothetical protein M1832_000614 [Thelocarpon impressellum]|nr:MAG: hypothetical protein M1832_000614 [Thelocarpon impressellum]